MFISCFNRLKVVILTGLLCCRPESAALAGMPPTAVTVHMLNGKLTKGLVDAETNDVHLVIRRESPNVLLRTRVPWMSVSVVTVGESVLSAEKMKSQISQMSSIGPKSAAQGISFITSSDQSRTPGPLAAGSSRGEIVPVTASGLSGNGNPARSVKSLHLITQLANWDSDAEIDGLLVEVRPLDQFGQLIPVEGQLNLKLLGISRTLGGHAQPGLSPVQFAANEGVTLLRPFSPTRDFHQMFRGTRTVPGEVRD